MKRIITRHGQSIMEYLIILAGIIAAVLLVKAMLQTKVEGSYNHLGNQMESAINKFQVK